MCWCLSIIECSCTVQNHRVCIRSDLNANKNTVQLNKLYQMSTCKTLIETYFIYPLTDTLLRELSQILLTFT